MTDTPEEPAPEGSEPLGLGIDWSDPNSPLAKYYLTAGITCAGCLLGLIFLFYSSFPVWHTDIWAHVKYGEWMLAHRTLPITEPFCPFADKDEPLTNFMWLSQVGYALLYKFGACWVDRTPRASLAGAAQMIWLFHLLLVTATYCIMLLALRRAGGSLGWACAGTLLLFLLIFTLWTYQRPQMVGEFCFAVLLYALALRVPSRRSMLLVPLLMIFWTNAHGSFIFGLAVIGLLTAGRAIEILVNRTGPFFCELIHDNAFTRLFWISVLSLAAASLFNPYGPMIWPRLAEFAAIPTIGTLEEWQPLPMKGGAGGGQGRYLFAAVLLLLVQALSPSGFRPGAILLILVFSIWPLLQERAVVWWFMLVSWLLVQQAPLAADRFFPDGVPSKPCLRKTILLGFVLALSLGLPMLRWIIAVSNGGGFASPARILSHGTPWQLALELKASRTDRGRWLPKLGEALEHYPDGKFTGAIFASETEGDFLIWALAPDDPVMMYTHAEVFDYAYWDDCGRAKKGNPSWPAFFDFHNVNLVVLEADVSENAIKMTRQLTSTQGWRVILNETGEKGIPDSRDRKLIVLREKPR